MNFDLKSPLNIARITTIALGIIVMGVGLHSHYKSVWVDLSIAIPAITSGRIVPYKLCENKYFKEALRNGFDAPCPRISLERYFVAMIIISLLTSITILVASIFVDLRKFKFVDLGIHIVIALLLAISAIVYIVSAEQINDLAGKAFRNVDRSFLRGEKLAAAALALINSAIYVGTGYLILRQDGSLSFNSRPQP